MNITLQYKGQTVADYADLVDCYPGREFASITRSTVPSLLFWAEGENRIEDLATGLGYEKPSSCVLDFEHEVFPPKGKGRPSCTDVMISWDNVAVGVEAKYTEPPYKSVHEWLKKGTDVVNRQLVLEGWLNLISDRIGKEVEIDTISTVPYQMIHRMASVCTRKEGEAILMYQVFNPNDAKQAYYRSNLKKIRNVLKDTDSVRVIYSVACIRTESFEEIN